jgi:hypothetical protein
MHSDTRIEAFRQEMKRLAAIPGVLDTLGITIARADELPGLIAKASYSLDRHWLEEEQAALGLPLTLRRPGSRPGSVLGFKCLLMSFELSGGLGVLAHSVHMLAH